MKNKTKERKYEEKVNLINSHENINQEHNIILTILAKIKKLETNKWWRGCGDMGVLMSEV